MFVAPMTRETSLSEERETKAAKSRKNRPDLAGMYPMKEQ